MFQGIKNIILVPHAMPDNKSTTSSNIIRSHPPEPDYNSLQIYLWCIYPDMAVFDWYISLAEKSRLANISTIFKIIIFA